MAEDGISSVHPLLEAAAPDLGAQVEFVLDSHRLSGEIRYRGAPRRLIDILNGIDVPLIAVYDAQLTDSSGTASGGRHFDAVHVRCDSILFAVPRSDPARSGTPFEAVAKTPVPVIIVLPGFEIAGNVHVAVGVDAMQALLGGSRFVPVTDAEIRALGSKQVGREPIVVVNLGRAQVYGPRSRG